MSMSTLLGVLVVAAVIWLAYKIGPDLILWIADRYRREKKS